MEADLQPDQDRLQVDYEGDGGQRVPLPDAEEDGDEGGDVGGESGLGIPVQTCHPASGNYGLQIRSIQERLSRS